MRLRLRMLTPWLPAVLLGGVCGGAAAQPTPAAKCAGAEHCRLDFWAGDWDVYEVGGPDNPVARARVEIILGGCALREIYQQADGLIGESYTTYDASRKLWHQTWVTNRGRLLQIEGRFQGESLTLQGPQLSSDGHEERLRGVWTPQDGGVREVAHTSADGGGTWRPLFDILFRRHKEGPITASASGASFGDDSKTIAALDTEYQAAVKTNDAATMDRILADDLCSSRVEAKPIARPIFWRRLERRAPFTSTRKIPIKKFESGATRH